LLVDLYENIIIYQFAQHTERCNFCSCEEELNVIWRSLESFIETSKLELFRSSTEIFGVSSVAEDAEPEEYDEEGDGIASESGCTDREGVTVAEGAVYKPDSDPCIECTCREGRRSQCVAIMCRAPTCEYEQIEGECCKYRCLDANDDVIAAIQCIYQSSLWLIWDFYNSSLPAGPVLACYDWLFLACVSADSCVLLYVLSCMTTGYPSCCCNYDCNDFDKMQSKAHCLYPLLPPVRSQREHYRSRGHDFVLPSCSKDLYKRSLLFYCFIILDAHSGFASSILFLHFYMYFHICVCHVSINITYLLT